MKISYLKKIDTAKCTNCGLCTKVCPQYVIDLQTKSFTKDRCLECCHCLAVCPEKAISFDGKVTDEIKNTVKLSDFKNLVYSRRSCRNYLDKEVPIEKLTEIADFLSLSPTGTNSQKVHMTILPTKEKVRVLGKSIMSFYIFLSKLAILLSPIMLIFLGLKQTKKILKMKKHLQVYIDGKDILAYEAPALFIFHAPKNASTPDQDCSIASTLGIHYAEIQGFGTCLNGFIVYAFRLNSKFKKMCKIPKNHRIYSTFLIGYPKYSFKREVLREKSKINIL
jgi:NAD-dependent dihydropyrimidine dehydrogenase PreA subunit/nitroreductase